MADRHAKIRAVLERMMLANGAAPQHVEMLFRFMMARWGHSTSDVRERVMALATYLQNNAANRALIYDLYFTDNEGLSDLITAAVRGTNVVDAQATKRARIAEPVAAAAAAASNSIDLVDQVISECKMELFDFQIDAVRRFQHQRGLGIFYWTGERRTCA